MRTCYQSVASHAVIRPYSRKKVYFILLFAHSVLVPCDKENLKWIFIPYDELWNESCVLYHWTGDIKHTTRFIVHRMEWKFIWDPIFNTTHYKTICECEIRLFRDGKISICIRELYARDKTAKLLSFFYPKHALLDVFEYKQQWNVLFFALL